LWTNRHNGNDRNAATMKVSEPCYKGGMFPIGLPSSVPPNFAAELFFRFPATAAALAVAFYVNYHWRTLFNNIN
jgi:hypothetical protein